MREYRNLAAERHPKYLMLVDPFILFHYSFLDPSHCRQVSHWSDFVADQGRFNAWRGNAFEIVCLYHVRQLKAALGIGGVETREYPWRSARQAGGAQVDLVIERADRMTDLCEMKFTDLPYELSRAHEQEMMHRRAVYQEETGTKQALKTVLVSVNGTSGYHNGSIAQVITADDLFRS